MINLKSFISKSAGNIFYFPVLVLLIILINGCDLPNIIPDPQEDEIEISLFEEDQMVDFGEEVTLTAFASHSSGANVEVMWEIRSQPNGSTLTLDNPTENTITFLPDELGEYVIRFTASSSDGLSEFEEIVITVIKAPVRLTGTISSDLILENIYDDPEDPDYLVQGELIIDANVIVEQDVLILFEGNAGIHVSSEGSLKAVGTSGEPIVFTGTQSAKGHWKGINFESRTSENELKYATISYGGGSGFDGANRKANITLNNAIVRISNCSLTQSEGIGLLTRHENDELPEFTDNVLRENLKPMEINKSQFHYLDITSDFSGNEEDYIDSWGQNALSENVTWQALNVPYRLRKGHELIESDLTIEKGSVFIGQNESGILITANGSISAMGTATEPIVFKGAEDVRGYWKGIEIQSNTNKNELVFVTIKNGGQSGFDGANQKANLGLNMAARLKMKNCTLERSSDTGLKLINVEAQLTEFENNIIRDNKIPIECKVNHFHYFDNASDLTGNDEDVIITTWANAPTTANVTWKKTTVPYKITKTDYIESEIIIEPGAEFIFTDDSGLEVSAEGTIIAEGTNEDPIVFRGDEDVHGYWRGLIVFSKSASNILSNVHIMNGGSKPYNGAKSNVIVWREARIQISNCQFSFSGGYGIGVGKDGILTESGNTFENNIEGDIYYE